MGRPPKSPSPKARASRPRASQPSNEDVQNAAIATAKAELQDPLPDDIEALVKTAADAFLSIARSGMYDNGTRRTERSRRTALLASDLGKKGVDIFKAREIAEKITTACDNVISPKRTR